MRLTPEHRNATLNTLCFSKGGGSMLLDRSDAASINWHDDDADTEAPDAKPAPLKKDTAGR